MKIEKMEAEEVTTPFLTRRTWYRKALEYLIGEITISPERLTRQAPLMFYMDEEGEITTYKNVSTGVHHPTDRWGRRKDFHNIIESRKICRFNYGGAKIPCYIHYEKELYAYPHEPKLDALQTVKALKIIQANYKEYDLRDSKLTQDQVITWLYMIGGVVGIALGAMWLYNTFDLGSTFGIGKSVVETVVPVETPTATVIQ